MKENIPSDEYLEACFKLFIRFLKDRGQYTVVMKYLFCDRTKGEFFQKVKQHIYSSTHNYDFGDILHIIGVLGEDWRKRAGIGYFRTIYKISIDFIDYWRNNADTITVPFNEGIEKRVVEPFDLDWSND